MCSEFVVKVLWKRHSEERYTERVLKHGFTKTEAEYIVRKQEVKTIKGYDKASQKDIVEAIGAIGGKLFTIQKLEDKNEIIIITLWESNEKEAEIWDLRKK